MSRLQQNTLSKVSRATCWATFL